MKKKLFLTRIMFRSRKSKKNKRERTFFIRQHMKGKKKLSFDIKKTVLDKFFNEDKPKKSSFNEDNEMNAENIENEKDFITELPLFMN